MRERLLSAIRVRLLALLTTPDPKLLVGADALAEADQLLEFVGDPARDLEVAHAVGLFHLARHQVLRGGPNDDDLRIAVTLLALVHRVSPDQVPEPVRTFFRQNPSVAANLPPLGEDGPEEWTEQARHLLDQVERTWDPAVMTKAVDLLRRALAASPPGHPNHVPACVNLGFALRTLSGGTGDADILAEAVKVGRYAVAASPPGHPSRAGYLTDLGAALRASFRVTGDPGTLAEAVGVHREAAASTSPGALYHVRNLREFGTILLLLFQETGNTDDLTEAVEMNRAALAATPSQGPEHAGSLRDFGITLMILFRETGNTGDLTEAVGACRAALAATPPGHSYYAPCSMLLGSALRLAFERTGDLEDLHEAVRACRAALAATPPEDVNYTNYANTLAMALLSLSQRTTEEPNTRDEAVRLFRRSLAVTPREHTVYATYSYNLGAALGLVFNQTGDADALAEAVRTLRDSLAATPPDHPTHGECASALGHSLWKCFELTGDPEVREEADALLAEVVASAVSSTKVRFQAMRGRAWVARSAGDGAATLSALEDAIALLPQFSPRRLSREDREHGLGRTAWIAAEAASAAIQMGRPDRAVELLEQVRGVLLAETMGVRGDLSELHAHAPELAAEFVRLRDELDAVDSSGLGFVPGGLLPPPPNSPGEEGGALPPQAARRLRLAHEWDDLLTRIREVPGLTTFLLPPSIDDLRGQAADGPIVIVNVSTFRCDALILTPDADRPVKLVELPRLTIDAVVGQTNLFQSSLTLATGSPSERLRGQRQVRAVLAWLWDEIAGPVLSELALTGPAEPDGTLPRLWWCPIGEMAFLPLHAAGHHGRAPADVDHPYGTPSTVLDRVISSYTTTVRALRYARQAHRNSPGPDAVVGSGALIIAMPETPGAIVSALPSALSEAQRLTALLPGSRTLTGPDANHDSVLAALPHHRIAHLACHGLSNENNPAAGRLLLHDHETRPLTVTALARLHLTHADLAYLSACSTTGTSQRLADQAVHLTGAFQLVGYKHVVGTLWSINDRVAATISDKVYTHLTEGGTTEPRSELTAHALHRAVRRLRDDYPASPTLWASHIHAGI